MSSKLDILQHSILSTHDFIGLITQRVLPSWPPGPIETAILAAIALTCGAVIWSRPWQRSLDRRAPRLPHHLGTQLAGLLCLGVHGVLLLQSGAVLLWQQGTALALYGAALALIAATMHAAPKSAELVSVTGPYRVVRDPLYTAALVAYMAGVLATGEPWLLLTVLIMGTLYAVAARAEEARIHHAALSETYRLYAITTGLILPRFPFVPMTRPGKTG